MQTDSRIPGTDGPQRIAPKSELRRRFIGVLYYAGLCAAPFAIGGVDHLASDGMRAMPEPNASVSLNIMIAASIVSGLLILVPGFVLYRHSPKRLAFGTLWCLFLVIAVLLVGEAGLRFRTPAWPAIGLHGVAPEVARTAWAHTEKAEDGFNDWGQRDRAREIVKPPNTFRIALIGDSFLEESSSVPVSLRVERRIGRADVEVMNLGVSATEPDEYYYRVKNIATALDVDHCVLCVFAGNDFSAPARTLPTTAGIVAVYPRGSMFSSLGLRAWNHLLTNEQRPVLQAWFASGDLHAAETKMGEAIAEADDQRLRDLLYSTDYYSRNERQRATLAARLNSAETTSFFQVLRNPDEGLFRSYYLAAALWSASVGGGRWESLSEDNAWHWIQQTSILCRERRIGLTLVIIPEAFQVDTRMIEQWMPLTDMQTLTATCRTTSARLVKRAASEDIQTIDLHDAFVGVPGTYLNLDGHWSDKGAELAADVLSQMLKTSIPAKNQ